ncbi:MULTISPECIES: IS1 family transposase [Cyanophyceae]|uniref:IS1 family transposase n=1 Tax=Cyanophyceae TaxID=3028117 RepID=UPI001686C784|nr:IS1 family transposase [Trichocoleus sp. FACHB-69]MBD1930956.1 IS1 family transposase [Trichocoleus sp. FACHB-69]
MQCPKCDSRYVVKNGHTHTGKQNFKCRDCGRQFVTTPSHQPVSKSTRELIDRLLLEKISLAGIVRATGVSERWLQYYVNQKLGAVKREVQVTSKKKGKLIIQCDEMWSFVGCKGNKQWIWLAIDILTKEIVGVYIGKRDESGAIGLWGSLPAIYRQCAVSYTDFWSAYQIVFPKKRHKSVSKDTGKTNYIERFNNTMRQRISRLVRKTLSFSKKLSNHIGAIWYFIHEYNASLSIELKA